MLGVGGGTVFSGLLVITLWIVMGLLVRFSFIGAFSRTAERTLSKYIPGYDTYKTIAEEKLQHKVRVLPYSFANKAASTRARRHPSVKISSS
jgi:hypothetical protein